MKAKEIRKLSDKKLLELQEQLHIEIMKLEIPQRIKEKSKNIIYLMKSRIEKIQKDLARIATIKRERRIE